MTRPIRWLDDPHTTEEIRELIRAGSHPPRFPKLALAASVIPLAQKTALASTWSLPSAAVIALKATSVGLVVGLGSIAAVTTVNQMTHDDPARVEPLVPAQSVAQSERAPRPSASSATEHAEPPTQQGELANTAVAAPSLSAAESTGIAREAQLLERARALLDESPVRALMLAEEHRARFSAGQMAAERELIAIDALLRLGRNREARQRAKPLLTDRTSQVFARRLRSLLDQHAE